MADPINFTLTYRHLTNDVDDLDGDVRAMGVSGTITVTPQIPTGAAARAWDAGYTLRRFTGVLDGDGVLRSKLGGPPGMRVWACDPVLNLTRLPYRVEFALVDSKNRPLRVDGTTFDAPPNDVVVDLNSVLPVVGAVAVGVIPPPSWSTLPGKPPVVAAGVDAAAARGVIGAGTYSKPGSGIPATDLSAAAQSSLGKADSALQALPAHGHAADQITETSELKVMTAAERTKLSGVAAGATANATDAQLRDRGAHTGTEPVAGGGTGRTSHTAYAPVLGGESTTGAQQSMAAPPALAGPAQVIKSAGAGVVPVWGTVRGDDLAHTTRVGVFQLEHCANYTTLNGTGSVHTRRHLALWQKPSRFRVWTINWNLLTTVNPTGSLTNVSVHIGTAALDSNGEPSPSMTAAPVQLLTGATLSGGVAVATPWITPATYDWPVGRDVVLAHTFGYNTSQVAIGGGRHFYSFNAADATAAAPTLTDAPAQNFLDIWVEYEYADDNTPSIFVVSNSISGCSHNGSGMTPSRGALDSWMYLWAASVRGAACGIHVPGSWAAHYASTNADYLKRWNFYSGLSQPLNPDVVVYMALMSSDVAGGDGSTATLNQAKASMRSAVAVGQSRFPNAQHWLTKIPPRVESTAGSLENGRISSNQWLSTSPGNADRCLDIASLASNWASPERLRTHVDSGDGTHFSADGHGGVLAPAIPPIRRRLGAA